MVWQKWSGIRRSYLGNLLGRSMAGMKWQISDELWEKMASLLPEHKTRHPLGTHRRRVDNRAAMNAISSCSEQVVSGMR